MGWLEGRVSRQEEMRAELSAFGLLLGCLMPSFPYPHPMGEHGVFRMGFLEEVTSEPAR